MTQHAIFNQLHEGLEGSAKYIYIVFMLPKNIIALTYAKYAHQSKQNIEQATMAILGVSICQTRTAPLCTETSRIRPHYFYKFDKP